MKFLDYRAAFRLQIDLLVIVIQKVECR